MLLEERKRFEQDGRPRRLKVSNDQPPFNPKSFIPSRVESRIYFLSPARYLTRNDLQYGIFFAGWPPVSVEGDTARCLLADECEDVIDVPTCHIVGCNDPYIHGAMALYSMCDEDTATLFDHGKGHTVPRDARTISELSSAIKTTLKKGEVAV